jgi:hypothetical protein
MGTQFCDDALSFDQQRPGVSFAVFIALFVFFQKVGQICRLRLSAREAPRKGGG